MHRPTIYQDNEMTATAKKTVIATKTIKRRGRATGSMADQIDRLQAGESVSLSKRFDIGNHAHAGDDIKTEINSMRGTLGSYVSRVMQDGDGLDMREYRTESGAFVTDDKTGVIVSVVLTRMS